MSGPRVLLMQLSERTSAKGNPYLSGWLGKARLVGFKAKEPDKFGNVVWEIYAQDPEPRAVSPSPTRNAERGQRTHDRSRDAGQRPVVQSRETRPGHYEAWSQPPEETPFYDDSAAAISDLEGGGR